MGFTIQQIAELLLKSMKNLSLLMNNEKEA
jgi:hypothetical protein